MAQCPKQQFSAANSDTPYAISALDLEKAGPMVIEMPPNPLLIGLVNDHNMRWVQTIPGKGWFLMVRLYGPRKEAFDGSWTILSKLTPIDAGHDLRQLTTAHSWYWVLDDTVT